MFSVNVFFKDGSSESYNCANDFVLSEFLVLVNDMFDLVSGIDIVDYRSLNEVA